jgi:hypothetical protein
LKRFAQNELRKPYGRLPAQSANLNGQMDLSSAGMDRYNGGAYQFKRASIEAFPAMS